MYKLKNVQARRFMLTINNETRSDNELYKYMSNLEHIKYFIFQREKDNQIGIEHIHVFVVFSISKRFGTIKNYFPNAYIEKCRGTNAQCRDYCSKNETRIGEVMEYGQFAEERARTDLK